MIVVGLFGFHIQSNPHMRLSDEVGDSGAYVKRLIAATGSSRCALTSCNSPFASSTAPRRMWALSQSGRRRRHSSASASALLTLFSFSSDAQRLLRHIELDMRTRRCGLSPVGWAGRSTSAEVSQSSNR